MNDWTLAGISPVWDPMRHAWAFPARVGAQIEMAGSTVGEHPTVTGLSASAHATLSSTGIIDGMSPQARLLNGIQVSALSDGVGQELSALPAKALSMIVDQVGVYATSVLGDVASVVPLIGQAIDMFASMWAEQGALDAQKQAALAQKCNWGPPVASGAGLKLIPADLFAPFYGVSGHYTSSASPTVRWDLPQLPVIEPAWVGTAGSRSAVGDQLISVTESPLDYGSSGFFVDDYAYELMKEGARLATGQKNLGVSPAKRALFTKLRMAIQTGWRPLPDSPLRSLGRLPGTPLPYPEKGVSDGGRSLWPAYLDLLSDEVEQGHITREMLAYFDSHIIIKPDHAGEANQGHIATRVPGAPGCWEATWNLIEAWRSTIDASYSQDVAAQKDLQEQVDKALASITGKVGMGSAWTSYAKASGDRTRAGLLLGAGVLLAAGGAYALYNPAGAMALYHKALTLGAKASRTAVGYAGSAVRGARSLVRWPA